MGKKKATLIRDNLKGWTGHAALYRLDPPISETIYDNDNDDKKESVVEHKYVVVSSIHNVLPMVGGMRETYIFPSDGRGKIKSWSELDGSMKDTVNHRDALVAAGYDEIELSGGLRKAKLFAKGFVEGAIEGEKRKK